MNNPIVELAEYCQSVFKQSILTEVLGKTGPDHNPVVEVQITLPDSTEFIAKGANQKIAKQTAAIKALAYLKNKKHTE